MTTHDGATGDDRPVVTIVMPFLNTDLRFFEEAVKSVLSQTYEEWELLLVDDGSETEISQYARARSMADPGRIRYLEHPGHRNLGASAARRLGMEHARGSLLSFLDSDDIWLAGMLEERVRVLQTRSNIGMTYGNTRYWYGWTGMADDARRDFIPDLGVSSNEVIPAPGFLEHLVVGAIAIPCTCSVMVRMEVARLAGGFDDGDTLYEDQRFYARVALIADVLPTSECLNWYRQHPNSFCAVSGRSGRQAEFHAAHLNWLEELFETCGIEEGHIWRALRRQQWLYGARAKRPLEHGSSAFGRRLRKRILKIENALLPEAVSRRIWSR